MQLNQTYLVYYNISNISKKLEPSLYTSEKHIEVKTAELNKEPPNGEKIINNVYAPNNINIIREFIRE